MKKKILIIGTIAVLIIGCCVISKISTSQKNNEKKIVRDNKEEISGNNQKMIDDLSKGKIDTTNKKEKVANNEIKNVKEKNETHKAGKNRNLAKVTEINSIGKKIKTDIKNKENEKSQREDHIKKTNPVNFIMRDKEIVGITKEGREEIEKTGELDIPKGVTAIKDGVFEALGLRKIKLPNTLESIGKYSFASNNLSEIELPSNLTKIDRGAFDDNNLSEIELKNPKCYIDGIFYNKQYVNIITSNPDIKEQCHLDTKISFHKEKLDRRNINPYGSVVNRASVDVFYYDENEQPEFGEILVSKDRKNRNKRLSDNFDKYYKIGEEINVVARKNDYLHLGNIKIEGGIHSKVEFHYNSASPEIVDEKENKSPKFNGLNQPILIIIGSIGASSIDYKDGVFASDYKLNNISENIKVLDSEKVDIKTPGVYEVNYEVKDSEGNMAKGIRKVYVEEKNEWYSHDFYYDGDVLLGLSQIGEYKLNEILYKADEKIIKLPEISDTGNKVTKVGSAAFARLRIRGVVIPKGYEEVRAYGFESTYLSELELPESMVSVGERAFAFTEIQKLYLPNKLEKIESRAFASASLKEIKLPANIKELGEGAFMNNSKLDNRQLEIPGSLKKIEANTFENCRLTKLILNEGLEEIEDNAFGKNDLTEVKYLPDSLKILAPAAFKQNGISNIGAGFKAVKLYTKDGKNPNNFKTNAFQEINPLEIKEDEENYTKEDFEIKEGTVKLSEKGKIKAKKNKNLVIPDEIDGKRIESIASIGFMAKNFETVKLPKYLIKIENSAFYSNNFEKIELPNSVKIIEGSAFFGNKNLKEIILSDSLEVIKSNAFMNTGLTKVKLPETIKTVEKDAFKSKESNKKVILTIQYNEKTKKFIEANIDRTDLKLEVLGAPDDFLTKKEILLKNKPTAHGIRLGDRLQFELKGISQKPLATVNGQAVPLTRVGNTIYISAYKEKIVGNGQQIFVFKIDDKSFQVPVKFFEPEEVKIENEQEEYDYSQGLKLKLKRGLYEFQDMKVYRNKSIMMQEEGIVFKDNELIIPKTLVDEIREDNAVELSIEGSFHKRTQVKIKLKTDEKKESLDLKLLENNDDTYIYESNELSEELFNEIKKQYEDDKINITIGRTTYEKDEYGEKNNVEEDKYLMEFDEETHKFTFSINKPTLWETLSFEYGEISLAYSIEDEFKLVREE